VSTGRRTGGADGANRADEPNDIKHVRGVVSMARSDEPNSASTHFFILVGDAHISMENSQLLEE
jgi:peptidyl-prolyl cis-trans isomerase B (cyclophilin B)